MANKKLNVGHRDALKKLATKLIAQTQDTSAFDAAYAALAKVIHARMVKLYPPQDMAVLLKYDMARSDACIHVTKGFSDYDRFNFREADPLIPVRPGDRYGCNGRTPIMLEGSDAEAHSAFQRAEQTHKAEVAQRQKDFDTLIDSAMTFEELVAIWPAADALRERILGTSRALSVMSEDVVARIKADAAALAQVEQAA